MVVKHSVVATFADEAGAEVNKTEWNADHVIDDGSFTIAKTTALQTTLDAKEVTSGKNAASGYAGLDATSKLTGSQQTYGTLTNTACEGNDSRLSDTRTPSAHNQTASTITDFDTQVRTSTFNQLAVPTASLDFNSKKGINVTDPTSAQDVASKAYVDALSNGLAVKNAVNIATTANIILSGHQVIDGITTTEDMRVLVKDQTAGEDNGYYLAKAVAWVRSTDADVSAEVSGGMFAWVITGTVNGAAGFALTTAAPITLDTTPLTFTHFSGLGQVVAGSALTKSLNTIDVAVDGVGIEVISDALQLKNDGVVTSKILNDNITTAKILDDNVTLAKIQDIPTTTILGRSTAGTGTVEELTALQALTLVGAGVKPLFYQLPADVTTAGGGGNIFGVEVTLTAGTTYKLDSFFHNVTSVAGGTASTTLGGTATLSNIEYKVTHKLVAAIPITTIAGGNSAATPVAIFLAPAIVVATASPMSWSGTFTCTGSGTLSFNLNYAALTGPTAATATTGAGASITLTPVAANGTWA